MVEIAICLAVVGFALVAIMRVLPIGMHVQQNNREETIINQDASVILESIRNGVRSGGDLTNYIYAITNYWTLFSSPNNIVSQGTNGYAYTGSFIYGEPAPRFMLTNNARIIGLLSTPEFLCANGFTPTNNLFSPGGVAGNGGYSNHIYAYVRSLSGPAVEKPPQDNPTLLEDSFSYRILCVNAPVATDTNQFGQHYFGQANEPDQQIFDRELSANLHELRLTFAWPLLPNGAVSSGMGTLPPMTQRTMVAGGITVTNTQMYGQYLFYYQSQSFNNVP
jgi:hypothetical protein